MPAVVFLSGRHKGRRISLVLDRVILGRDKNCEIMLDDVSSSRAHTELVKSRSGYLLRDLGSTNGTFLNNRRTTDVDLSHGDKITIGETQLVYLDHVEETPSQVAFHEGEQPGQFNTSARINLAELNRTTRMTGKTDQLLDTLQRFNQEVTSAMDLDALLSRVLTFFFQVLPVAERASVMLLSKAGDLENNAVKRREDNDESPIRISKVLAEQVISTGEAMLSVDVRTDERLGVEDTATGASSVMLAPLVVQDKRLGLVYVDTTKESFTEGDLHLLSFLAVQVAIALDKVRLYTELMNTMQYQSSILHGMMAGIIVTDPAGVVSQINPAALETIGLDEDDVLGKPIQDIQNLRPISALMVETRRARKSFDRKELELVVDGEVVTVGLSTSVLTDVDGAIAGIIASFRDITIIKKLSAKVKMTSHLAALGEMAAGVAHEIRNPLNSIRGFAQLLEEKVAAGDHQEWANIIVEQVDRMDQIVQGLLDYSRQHQFTMGPTDIVEVIRSLLAECRTQFAEKKIEVKLLAETSLPPAAGNENKLRQVFLNIILNAMDAVEEVEGGGTLTIRVRLRRKGAVSEVATSITDNGSGIDPDHIGKLFDPFFTRKEIGTGLGLAISQRIISAHGGSIHVNSKLDEGSTFTVSLPCYEDAGEGD